MKLNDASELLEKLSARLPELEWQLSKFGKHFSSHSLPRGAFRVGPKQASSAYTEEIKADLAVLAHYIGQDLAYHMALKIENKINVLVKICQQEQKDKVSEPALALLDKMSTRQERLQSMAEEIQSLKSRRDSLLALLNEKESQAQSVGLLEMRLALGDLEKKTGFGRRGL